MTVLSDDAICRRLRSVDQSQESIETASLWIIHHKDTADKILSLWINVFRTAPDKMRLALFYVANDVCQKTKKRKGVDFLPGIFVPRLINAMALVRSNDDIKKKVLRMIDIWDQREIFTKPTLSEMRSTLNDIVEADDQGMLEFDSSTLINDLEKFQKIEVAIEKARIILSKGNFDFQSQIRERLKDRREGEKFLRDVDETCKKMSDFVTALESQLNQHHRLVELLEHARGFYGQQLRDATVVEDAYQKFGKGIQEVKDALEEMMRTGAYLGASPPRDAPSPSADDDPFASGVEEAIRDMKKPGSRDIIESADMDVDDETTDYTIHTGGMNLLPNQSFIGVTDNMQSMNIVGGGHSARMQRAAKSRIEAVNAQLAATDSMHHQRVGAQQQQQQMDYHRGATAPSPWMAPPNFAMPPPAMVDYYAMPPPANPILSQKSNNTGASSTAPVPSGKPPQQSQNGPNRRNLTVVNRT